MGDLRPISEHRPLTTDRHLHRVVTRWGAALHGGATTRTAAWAAVAMMRRRMATTVLADPTTVDGSGRWQDPFLRTEVRMAWTQ